MSDVLIIGYFIIGIIAYKFILGTLAVMLDFVAKRTENKLDDSLVVLLNRLIQVGRRTLKLLR